MMTTYPLHPIKRRKTKPRKMPGGGAPRIFDDLTVMGWRRRWHREYAHLTVKPQKWCNRHIRTLWREYRHYGGEASESAFRMMLTNRQYDYIKADGSDYEDWYKQQIGAND